MKKSFLVVGCLCAAWTSSFAASLPKTSVQALVKALQDSNTEVRTSAAWALSEVPDAAELATKALETALIASSDNAEQDALVKALFVSRDSSTPKRLMESLSNPQFNWGAGAKAKAVYVVGKIADKKAIPWLTDIVAGEQDPPIRSAAARVLGEIGAPPKKAKTD